MLRKIRGSHSPIYRGRSIVARRSRRMGVSGSLRQTVAIQGATPARSLRNTRLSVWEETRPGRRGGGLVRRKSKTKLLANSKRVLDSRKGERLTQTLISQHCGLRTKFFGGNNPSKFDILVDGSVRVECKDSRRGYGGRWHFPIARHGELNESEVDFYIFALRGMAKRARVYVILPAPIGKTGLCMSMRSLLTRYARFIDNWDAITNLARERRAAKTETGEAKPQAEQFLEAA